MKTMTRTSFGQRLSAGAIAIALVLPATAGAAGAAEDSDSAPTTQSTSISSGPEEGTKMVGASIPALILFYRRCVDPGPLFPWRSTCPNHAH